MNNFTFFVGQGLSHISDITAYDHILFITALCAVYPLKQWKTIVWLVTAFTIGHSIALALAVLEIVKLPSSLIEFLIPVTIFGTCIYNILRTSSDLNEDKSNKVFIKYSIVVFFGLIHGVGFSNYLRFILTQEESLAIPLLGFNIGLELGQLVIVAVALLLNFVFLEGLKMSQRLWIIFISILVGAMSIQLMIATGQVLFTSF